MVDPILGGGTTAMACLETGRRFIVVELSSEYATLAAARIRAAEEALKQKREKPGGVPDKALISAELSAAVQGIPEEMGTWWGQNEACQRRRGHHFW